MVNTFEFAEFIKKCKKQYGTNNLADACQIRRNQVYKWSTGQIAHPHQFHLEALKSFLSEKNDIVLISELENIVIEGGLLEERNTEDISWNSAPNNKESDWGQIGILVNIESESIDGQLRLFD